MKGTLFNIGSGGWERWDRIKVLDLFLTPSESVHMKKQLQKLARIKSNKTEQILIE